MTTSKLRSGFGVLLLGGVLASSLVVAPDPTAAQALGLLGAVQQPVSPEPVPPEDGVETPPTQESSDESGLAVPNSAVEQSPDVTPAQEARATGSTDAASLGLLAAVPLAAGTLNEAPNARLTGGDRYETAASASRHAYPTTADSVILVNGEDFPDSLSAAALSAKLGAPMLLTKPTVVPQSTLDEITRLRPTKILLVGGTGAVSTAVEAKAKSLAGTVLRIGGSDRFETAVEISKFGWASSSSVFIATGLDFADALAASAAAGTLRIPVLLVPGSDTSGPTLTASEISRLGAGTLRIAGGPGAVSTAMERSLADWRTVVRYGGNDRYETAALIARGVYQRGVSSSYWANGLGFADALAGAAVAGARKGILLLTRPDCVPSVSYSAHDALAPSDTYLLGGTGVLSDAVRNGNECMVRPASMSSGDWELAQQLYATINASRFDRNLGGIRVSDSLKGTPAQEWAVQVGSGKAKLKPDLASAQPWVRYQSAAVVVGTGNRAQRAFTLLQANTGGATWMYLPNGGARGYVSIGMQTVGQQTNAVIFFGAGLNK